MSKKQQKRHKTHKPTYTNQHNQQKHTNNIQKTIPKPKNQTNKNHYHPDTGDFRKSTHKTKKNPI